MHILSSREFVTVLSPTLRSTMVFNKVKRFISYFFVVFYKDVFFFVLQMKKLLVSIFSWLLWGLITCAHLVLAISRLITLISCEKVFLYICMVTAVFVQHSFNNIIPVNFYFCKANYDSTDTRQMSSKKDKLYVLLLSIKWDISK